MYLPGRLWTENNIESTVKSVVIPGNADNTHQYIRGSSAASYPDALVTSAFKAKPGLWSHSENGSNPDLVMLNWELPPPRWSRVKTAGFTEADLHSFPRLLNGYQILGVLLWKLDRCTIRTETIRMILNMNIFSSWIVMKHLMVYEFERLSPDSKVEGSWWQLGGPENRCPRVRSPHQRKSNPAVAWPTHSRVTISGLI